MLLHLVYPLSDQRKPFFAVSYTHLDVYKRQQQDHARPQQHPLELRAGGQELAVLRLGAEAVDVFGDGPRVPTAVEEDDLAPGRQVGHPALEVPLRLLHLSLIHICVAVN